MFFTMHPSASSPSLLIALILHYKISKNLTKTFRLICCSVDENFGRNDISEREEHLHQLGITKFLRLQKDKKLYNFFR